MNLPAHVEAALGVHSPITEADLIVAADSCPLIQTAFALTGIEFTEAVVKAQSTGWIINISKPSRYNRTTWKYLELYYDGNFESSFLTTPYHGNGLPPTAVGQALAMAWLSDAATVDGDGIPPGLLIYGSTANAVLKVLAAQLAPEWANVCFLLEGIATAPSWVTKSKLDILPNALLISPATINLKYDRLFLEAVSEFKSKWRFLSLYRILEHGYLLRVFKTLEADFFSLPKVSLEAALALVKSEVKQFVALADKASIQNGFVAFHDEFEKLKLAGNHLALAIEKSIQQSEQQGLVNGKWQMGVLLCYKLRCSIVHAGVSAPIFDSYPDGPVLLEALLPICESIVLDFLGVEIS